MDDSIERWLIGAAVLIVCVVAGCTVSTNALDNNAIVALVKGGSDAITAKCAIKSTSANECAMAALSRK